MKAYLRDSGLAVSYRDLAEQCASRDVRGMLVSLLHEGAVPEAVYREALATHRPALQAALEGYFKQHDLAAMIFPTTPMPARPIGDDDTVLVNGKRVPTFFIYIRNTDPAIPSATGTMTMRHRHVDKNMYLAQCQGTEFRVVETFPSVNRGRPAADVSRARTGRARVANRCLMDPLVVAQALNAAYEVTTLAVIVLGPVLGTVLVGVLSSELRESTYYWELIVAAVFVVVVLYAPGGLVAVLARLARLLPRRERERPAQPAPARALPGPAATLEIADVSATVGDVRILDQLSLAISRPGIYCLIGPNGAGKTSTFNMLTGELRAHAGRVRLDGEPLLLDEPSEGVQSENVRHMSALISEHKAAGRAFVVVEQNLALVEAIADRYVVLDQGRAVHTGGRQAFDRAVIASYLTV
jgi:ABC transporter